MKLSHCFTSVLRARPGAGISGLRAGDGARFFMDGVLDGLDDLGVAIVSLEISMMYVCFRSER